MSSSKVYSISNAPLETQVVNKFELQIDSDAPRVDTLRVTAQLTTSDQMTEDDAFPKVSLIYSCRPHSTDQAVVTTPVQSLS